MDIKSGGTTPQIFLELSSHYGEPNSDIFPRILEKLINQKEAEILLLLPGTSEEIAEKTTLTKEEITEILEDLYMRGLIVRTLEGNKTGYALTTLLDPILWEIGARKARGEILDEKDWQVISLFERHVTNRIIESPPQGTGDEGGSS